MVILLLALILFVLLGVISFEAITTVAAGVICGVILLVFFIARWAKRR